MIIISIDETHHIKNGVPLYNTRYKRVMSFHNNIAPVEDDNQSFFINKDNKKLFSKSFIKAYGFYENKSAVKDKDGWFHIDINGNNLYNERYSWVGNFSEDRCVVRDFDNNYFHIDEIGNRVYHQNYSYTGDYKYGIAVIVNSEGKSTHIDKYGKMIHQEFFDELNIFHKGYAIAKDKNGYFHINKNGQELYKDRYQKLEDFYNGYALATTFQNNKIVLNELDFMQLKISNTIIDKDKILNDSFAYLKYQILFAVLKLNILKKLETKKEINLPKLSKILIQRWLFVENIIDHNNNLTELGKVIEYELKPLILYWQDLPFKSSAFMVETLQKGDEYFSEVFKKPFFNFLEDNVDHFKLSREINCYYAFDYSALIKYLNFKNEIVCDIGGGSGNLLNEIKNTYTSIVPIVADKFIDGDKNQREINFFEEFKIDANIFLLSRILHDWSDDKALKILQNIEKNMNASSILYIFETIIPSYPQFDKGVTLSFHLLNFVGGYERTLDDFNKLLEKTNLKIVKVYEEDKLISLIEIKKI